MPFIYNKVVQLKVEGVRAEFSQAGLVARIRPEITGCGFCERPFLPDEVVHLAFVEGRSNRIICGTCKDTAILCGAKDFQGEALKRLGWGD